MIKREQFSEEQENAFVAMTQFVRSLDRQMLINGNAGCGKTTLLNNYVNWVEDETNYNIICTAPTNEAVRVIAKNTGRKYNKTIYSLLGLALVEYDDKKPVLKPQGTPKIKDYDIIVIDEASMINTDLFDMIQEQLTKFTYVKVIYMGDDAQLLPVLQPYLSDVFKIENESKLTQVQRTALDNPIIEVATKIRNNLNSETDDFQRISRTDDNGHGIEFWDDRDGYLTELYKDFTSDEYQKDNNYVRAILYTNKAVTALNLHIRRQIYGKKDVAQFEQGENLIVDKSIVKNMGKYSKVLYDVGERLRVSRVSKEIDPESDIEYWNLRVVNYEAEGPERITSSIKVVTKESEWRYHLELKELADKAKRQIKNGYSKQDAWKPYFQFKDEWAWVKYSYATTTHKCLPTNTLIASEYGMVELKNINVGDLVYAPSGALRKVLNKVNTGHKKVSEITLQSNQVLKSSIDHRWLVCDESGYKYIKTNDIKSGMYLRMSGNKVDGVNMDIPSSIYPDSIRTNRSLLPTNLSNDLGWLVGALIGDGCYSYKTNRVDFTNPSSPYLLTEYAKIIKSYGINPIYVNRNGIPYTISVDSLALRSLISFLGLGREIAGDKSIPSIFKSQTVEVKANLIAGLFDADGSVSKSRRVIRYGSKSRKLIDDIQSILLTLGIYSTAHKQGDNYISLSISSNHIQLFRELIPLRHPDKRFTLRSYTESAKEESDVIPHGYNMVKMMIDAYREKYPSTRGYKDLGFNSPSNRPLWKSLNKILSKDRLLSRNLLKRMIKFSIDNELIECVKLFSAENDGGRWVYIKDVVHTNEAVDMIDIEVDTEHAFIAEGYVTHNSQGSTFQRAYVIERDLNKLHWNDEERNRLKYVAFTRPSKLLRILH